MIWHWMCHVCADTRGAPVNLTCYWGSRRISCVHIQKCPCSHGQLHITFIKATGAKQRCRLVSYLSKQMNLHYKTFHTYLAIDITVHGLITKVKFWIGSDQKPTSIFTRTQISADILREVQKLVISVHVMKAHKRDICTAPINLGMRWRWLANLMLQPLSPRESRYPLIKRLGGPQNPYRRFCGREREREREKKKNYCPTRIQTMSHPSHSYLLYWLCCPSPLYQTYAPQIKFQCISTMSVHVQCISWCLFYSCT